MPRRQLLGAVCVLLTLDATACAGSDTDSANSWNFPKKLRTRLLGRQVDTERAGAEDGTWYLYEDDSSPGLNDAVIDRLIEDGGPITLVTDPYGDIGGSIYEQELTRLDDSGWQIIDNGDGTWRAESP